MQFSTKVRYALRAMMELAADHGEDPLHLKEIARRQGISDKYLEQVMAPLRTQGLVYTRKGSRGGYTLSRSPEEISLFEVVQAVEGTLAPVSCVDHADLCERVDVCATRDLWGRIKELVSGELKSMSLADLVQEQEKKLLQAHESPSWQI